MNNVWGKQCGACVGLGAMAVLALAGCGGGGGGSDSRTTIHGELHSGDETLADGSYVDVYSCTARDDSTARVEMKSSDLDSFLVIGVDDGAGNVQTIATDDNSGSGQDARTDFDTIQNVRYFVAATNADGTGHTGKYTLEFSDKLKDVTEEHGITPAVRAAAARAVREFRARQQNGAAPKDGTGPTSP